VLSLATQDFLGKEVSPAFREFRKLKDCLISSVVELVDDAMNSARP